MGPKYGVQMHIICESNKNKSIHRVRVNFELYNQKHSMQEEQKNKRHTFTLNYIENV